MWGLLGIMWKHRFLNKNSYSYFWGPFGKFGLLFMSTAGHTATDTHACRQSDGNRGVIFRFKRGKFGESFYREFASLAFDIFGWVSTFLEYSKDVLPKHLSLSLSLSRYQWESNVNETGTRSGYREKRNWAGRERKRERNDRQIQRGRTRLRFSAVVVTQLVEWLLLTSEVRCLNPVLGKIYLEQLFTVNWIEKTKIKKKIGWECPIFKKRDRDRKSNGDKEIMIEIIRASWHKEANRDWEI